MRRRSGPYRAWRLRARRGTETHQEFLNALKSASRMRSHGYPNWPVPSPNVSGVWVPPGVDTNSTQFRAAAKTCGVPVPPQRVANHKIDERTRPYPVGRMKGDRR